jgi:hypothetical protein
VRFRFCILTIAAVSCLTATASAQFQEGAEKGAELGQSQTQRWKCGVTVKAVGGPCRGIVATIPVPVDWPEQTVVISEEDLSPQVRVNQGRNVKAVPQMTVNIRSLPSGQEARALLTYDVTRSMQKPPADPESYKIAEDHEVPRDLRIYLAPSLPHIDCRDDRVRKLGDTLGAQEQYGWDRVKAIYDYVREKIEYTKGGTGMKGSIKALEDHTGNHEDLCFAFIAICRAAGIPARTVWVQNHCYPEFYLVDSEGEGHWFPCQVAGAPEFGGISDLRPILQKGDNFRDPFDRRKYHRYLPEKLNGAGGRPKVRFIRELLPG